MPSQQHRSYNTSHQTTNKSLIHHSRHTIHFIFKKMGNTMKVNELRKKENEKVERQNFLWGVSFESSLSNWLKLKGRILFGLLLLNLVHRTDSVIVTVLYGLFPFESSSSDLFKLKLVKGTILCGCLKKKNQIYFIPMIETDRQNSLQLLLLNVNDLIKLIKLTFTHQLVVVPQDNQHAV